jgi:non-ribosomal peptide synthetase component E (peptide arylation enzyme)
LVQMTWMIRGWVKSDSTNQPVWNRDGLYHQSNTCTMTKKGRVVED